MTRILVTGATGFIGRAVTDRLARLGPGEVVATARRVPTADTAGLRWIAADLLDADGRRRLLETVRPSHLLHLAWYAEHGAFWHSPENDRWRAASVDLFARFAAAGGRRFVGAGTCVEYDVRLPGPYVESVSPLAPQTRYGQAKAACFQDLSDLAARPGAPDFGWGRVFLPFGPGEDRRRLTSGVICALLRGETIELKAPDHRRDFIAVDDLAAAFASLLLGAASGPVNLASGRASTIADHAATIADLIGQGGLIRHAATPPPDDPRELTASVQRLRTEVGVLPAVAIETALVDLIAWWRRRL